MGGPGSRFFSFAKHIQLLSMEPDLVKLTRVEESLVTITCRAMRARWGGVLLAAVAMLLLLVSRCERDHAAAHGRRAFAVGDALSTQV